MRIIESLSEEERSSFIGVLSADAPDLLVDVQARLVTPGLRERIDFVLEERMWEKRSPAEISLLRRR